MRRSISCNKTHHLLSLLQIVNGFQKWKNYFNPKHSQMFSMVRFFYEMTIIKNIPTFGFLFITHLTISYIWHQPFLKVTNVFSIFPFKRFCDKILSEIWKLSLIFHYNENIATASKPSQMFQAMFLFRQFDYAYDVAPKHVLYEPCLEQWIYIFHLFSHAFIYKSPQRL